MLFSWFELLLLVGVVQGVATATSLLFEQSNGKRSNGLLAIFLLFFSGICFKTFVYSASLEQYYPWLRNIPLAFETALPALAYLYARAISSANFKLKRFHLVHFSPFFVFMTYALFIYVTSFSFTPDALVSQILHEYRFETVKRVEDYVTVLLILGYLIASVSTLRKVKQKADNLTADNEHAIFVWIRKIQMLMAVLLIFLIVNMIADRVLNVQGTTNSHWKVYFLYLAGVIYFLGFKARHLNSVIAASAENQSQVDCQPALEKDPSLVALAEKINLLIDSEQLFRNPALSIKDLSSRFEVNANTISLVINRHLQSSFRALINHKRIEFAKAALLSNQSEVSILSIALDAGFNSEASFYRVFKQQVGMTPTQYIKASRKHK